MWQIKVLYLLLLQSWMCAGVGVYVCGTSYGVG